MSCLSLSIEVNNVKSVVRSTWLEESRILPKADSSSVLIWRSLCEGEWSHSFSSSCEVSLVTIVKYEVFPVVWIPVKHNFYIFSAITNKIENLEIVVVLFRLLIFCLWREFEILSSSLDSAFTFSYWDFKLISPILEVLILCWFY